MARTQIPKFWILDLKFKNAISSSMLLILIQNFLHFQEAGIYIKQILDNN